MPEAIVDVLSVVLVDDGLVWQAVMELTKIIAINKHNLFFICNRSFPVNAMRGFVD